MGVQQDELHARLRGLRERAAAARRAVGASASQAVLEREVRTSGLPGAEHFTGKRASEWAPDERAKFKVPQAASDDPLLAMAAVWAHWAGEKLDQRWLRDQLVLARAELTKERGTQPVLAAAPSSQGSEECLQDIGPAVLEVHPAVLPTPENAPLPWLTPYLARRHDAELREAIGPALAGGTSMLAMLTGGSSTGKTRALFEALLNLAPTRPLLRPVNAGALLDLLETNRITGGTVLWLNESQRFLDVAVGEQAAAALRVQLEHQPGVVAVGTLWPEPYWGDLTREGVVGDPHGQARALLRGPRTRRITVASGLLDDDRDAWHALAQRHHDPRLFKALEAGGSDGHVVQHLSGGPELLAAYLEGPGGFYSPIEHALLTAALDARRLGHHAPLPLALLAEAADGALAAHHRSADLDWAEVALTALTTGVRRNDTRTDRRTLTPLAAVRARSGTAADYEPTDYLDQHIRIHRADQLGGAPLWDAMAAHAVDGEDLSRLVEAAWTRGLFRLAVRLGVKAIRAGHPDAPVRLVGRLHDAPELRRQALKWLADSADGTDPGAVAWLLRQLQGPDADRTRSALLARAVANVDLDPPQELPHLFNALWEAGELEGLTDLLTRAAAHCDVTSPAAVASLLEMLVTLRGAGKSARPQQPRAIPASPSELERAVDRAVTLLLARGPAAHADLTSPDSLAVLLLELRAVGATEAVATLLARDPAARIDISDLYAVADLLGQLKEAGAVEAAAALMARDLIAHADLTDLHTVPWTLRRLQSAGAEAALITRIAHAAAAGAALTDPLEVAELLRALRDVGINDAVAVLLGRDPASHVDLPGPNYTEFGILLVELEHADAFDQVTTLRDRVISYAEIESRHELGSCAATVEELERVTGDTAVKSTVARRVVAHAELSEPGPVSWLLEVLHEAGATDEVAVLVARDPGTAVRLADPAQVTLLVSVLSEVGATGSAALLADRAVAHTDFSDGFRVAELLQGLREAGAGKAFAALLARDPAAHIDVTDPLGAAFMLRELDEAGAEQAVETLLAREPDRHANLSGTNATAARDLIDALLMASAHDAGRRLIQRAENAGLMELGRLRPFGREADGRPSAAWTWSDISC
ncbi:hypothetical protein AB0O82_23595 [Kitasatospora sp. NPDC088264]|uniref:hypothetical protein n=1 Tax=Kitasatospora sp. NPDC088264 TaxID=3155296 RepID=UPI0034488A52